MNEEQLERIRRDTEKISYYHNLVEDVKYRVIVAVHVEEFFTNEEGDAYIEDWDLYNKILSRALNVLTNKSGFEKGKKFTFEPEFQGIDSMHIEYEEYSYEDVREGAKRIKKSFENEFGDLLGKDPVCFLAEHILTLGINTLDW